MGEELEIPKQVARLIDQATNLENLCQHYIGMLYPTNLSHLDFKIETDWVSFTIRLVFVLVNSDDLFSLGIPNSIGWLVRPFLRLLFL